ncbi:MAG: MFS transporter, partial [Oligoflexia bacterium]|nr:MFS transporter [Oligoflexia bacterium]
MSLKPRIAVMQFIQFFTWGSWMPMMATWWFGTQHWSAASFGATFATMGIASVFMPTIMGMIADRWMNAEKLYSLSLFCSSILHFIIPQCTQPTTVFWIMLLNMCFYMPTLGLSYSIAYSSMEKAGMNIVKEYPPVRVWGTVGFIVAMWVISISKLETSCWIFYIAGISSSVLGIYALTMPKCPPIGTKAASWFDALGLDAFKVFKSYRMAVFFVFSMLLGVVLQLSNAYANVFIHSFEELVQYKDCLAVKYPAIIMSTSQISETFMILLVPFFLKRFGIKKVMVISMFG